MKSCTGPCRQGRDKCPVPSACELPITFAGPEPFDWKAVVLWAALTVAFFAAALGMAMLIALFETALLT